MIIKINIFRGDLSDVSAKTATLLQALDASNQKVTGLEAALQSADANAARLEARCAVEEARAEKFLAASEARLAEIVDLSGQLRAAQNRADEQAKAATLVSSSEHRFETAHTMCRAHVHRAHV